MARPPVLTPAETDGAAWMRQYRAWRSGRGPNPGPRRAWMDEQAKLRGEVVLEDAVTQWARLRDAVLERGGICPNADFGYDEIPSPVYRVHGKPADIMAQLVTWETGYEYANDSELIADLWKCFEEYRRVAR